MASDFSSPPESPDAPRQVENDALESLPPVVLGHLPVHRDDPAEETPLPILRPYRARAIPLHHELGSRELMLGWCFWLLGSWFALGMGLAGTPIRWMILASLLGLLVAWPAFRLSQDGGCARGPAAQKPGHAAPRRRSRLTPGLILRDWFALNGVFQAVIWPHLLTGLWHLDQAMWISFAVASWSLLAGAIVAWGCGSCSGAIRLAAMYLVLLLLLGEPAILAALSAITEQGSFITMPWTMHISPIEAVFALTARPVDFEPGPWAATVCCILLAAIGGWFLVLRGALVHHAVSR
jgi:hypothetical protein